MTGPRVCDSHGRVKRLEVYEAERVRYAVNNPGWLERLRESGMAPSAWEWVMLPLVFAALLVPFAVIVWVILGG